MDWEQIQRLGAAFQAEGRTFYDLLVGPGNRRIVACGVGVLHTRYGFFWYYNPDVKIGKDDPPARESAAKTLINQYRFSLIDHRSKLLPLGKLDAKGSELKVPPDMILVNELNQHCSNRDYAAS